MDRLLTGTISQLVFRSLNMGSVADPEGRLGEPRAQRKRLIVRKVPNFGHIDLISLLIFALLPLLQSCLVPAEAIVPVRLTNPLAPVVSSTLAAPRAAGAISIAPSEHCCPLSDQRIYMEFDDTRRNPSDSGLIATLYFATMMTDQNPTLWASDRLKARLENAGYSVLQIYDIAKATTPTTIIVGVSNISAATKNSGCSATIDLQIEIVERHDSLFVRSYRGSGEQAPPAGDRTGCTNPHSLSDALSKALDGLLDRTLPELAPVLAGG